MAIGRDRNVERFTVGESAQLCEFADQRGKVFPQQRFTTGEAYLPDTKIHKNPGYA